TISRMFGHWRMLLEGIVASPERPLSTLPLITDTEFHQLVLDWNDTVTAYPRDKSIVSLFEETVARYPDHIAVEFGPRRLTYRELNALANRLAHCLQEWRIGPDTLVGVCMDRSVEMIIS